MCCCAVGLVINQTKTYLPVPSIPRIKRGSLSLMGKAENEGIIHALENQFRSGLLLLQSSARSLKSAVSESPLPLPVLLRTRY